MMGEGGGGVEGRRDEWRDELEWRGAGGLEMFGCFVCGANRRTRYDGPNRMALPGLTAVIQDFHAAGVTVLFPWNHWGNTTGHREPDANFVR